jgi:hypothetical protein
VKGGGVCGWLSDATELFVQLVGVRASFRPRTEAADCAPAIFAKFAYFD